MLNDSPKQTAYSIQSYAFGIFFTKKMNKLNKVELNTQYFHKQL